ncbi:uncharacterized protein LOC143961376 [Lithobates pipiens]
MMSCVLILLMLCLWDRIHNTSGQHCIDQPTRMESLVGGEITIPCQIAFPVKKNKIKSVNVAVRASADRNYCGRENDEIYNKTETSMMSSNHQERINVHVDLDHRNATITIKNLLASDGAKNYCLRLKLKFEGIQKAEEWQDAWGTLVLVKGEREPGVETIPVIFASPGENVTLLSHIKIRNGNTLPNITACRIGPGTPTQSCLFKDSILSFKINQVNRKHQGSYWWEIETSTSKGKTSSNHPGPDLQIIGKTNSLNIIQSEDTEFHRHTTINCSFTVQQKSGILRTEVYWMIGDPREDYVYHPNPDYIHPDYKGKTRLVDGSNLLLEDFHGPDNTTFYCRVIIRKCFANEKILSSIRTILEDGAGTRLRIRGNSTSIFPIVLGVVVVFLVIFIVLVICWIKTRGNKPPNSGDTFPETTEKPEDIKIPQQGEHLVYATINHSSSSTLKKTESSPDPDTEVLYADVKKK